MRSLLAIFEDEVDKQLLAAIKQHCHAEVVRFDLAWELFLDDKGTNQQGELDLPPGNPRTQWMPLHLWIRQTLGGMTNLIGTEQSYVLGVITRCSAAALEYVSRMLSMYSHSLEAVRIGQDCDPQAILDAVDRLYCNGSGAQTENNWLPPIINPFDTQSAFLHKSSGIKNGDHYTWLTGFLGSNRLFSQIYELRPNSSANRLHSHSDVDEMFVVLDGSGYMKSMQGTFPIKKGDVIAKPGGSSLAAQFVAGDAGVTILDIECWTQPEQTDLVIYPDHHEAALRGRGLNHGVSLASLFPGDDISKHYYETYRRDSDGKKT